ncbi:MAG: hypothetical protein B7Z67_02285 [Acidiphilium sp. 21-60-14]|nr:MAG: hypothetical protein B7Z67_02285 [Acidiphilium sp. 21-60-14]OYV92115.1 MAG: hypothetical protein B7Z57_02140 [Acidiphilium sp. 37-60-79]OZB38966.1 MAG: hypothetical protein B7X48_11040 [Acidiphilium sp. 34-60-192]
MVNLYLNDLHTQLRHKILFASQIFVNFKNNCKIHLILHFFLCVYRYRKIVIGQCRILQYHMNFTTLYLFA